MMRASLASRRRQRCLVLTLLGLIAAVGSLAMVAIGKAGLWGTALYLMQSYAGVR